MLKCDGENAEEFIIDPALWYILAPASMGCEV